MVEKLIYLLVRPVETERRAFTPRLLEAGRAMLALDPKGLRVNVQDAAVDWGEASDHHPALGRVSPHGPFEAVVQLWLDDISAPARAPYEALMGAVASAAHGYHVAERLLVTDLLQGARPGGRNDGYSQMAMLQIPARLTREAWLSAWQDRHTWVALSIHPHLEYIQNVVLNAVTEGAPPVAGFGEEAFPMAGLHDERPLFPRASSEADYKALYQVMYDDAARFIDFDRLDMLVSSQFDLRPVAR